MDIDIVFLVSSKHPIIDQKKLSIHTLSEYPWAVVDEHHSNTLYDYIFTQQGMEDNPVKVKTNSLTLLQSLVARSYFITMLPQHMVQEDINRGDICVLEIDNFNLRRKGGLIYRDVRLGNPEAETLMETIRELCA